MGTQWKSSLLFVLLLCGILRFVDARGLSSNEPFNNQNDEMPSLGAGAKRQLKFLVQDPQTILDYHNGPLLTAPTTQVYILWYGNFSDSLKTTVRDFFTSLNYTAPGTPTVNSWWNLTSGYKDSNGSTVSSSLNLAAELDDPAMSLGLVLNDSHVEELVVNSVSSTFPENPEAVYIVMTSADVDVNDFCMNSCAAHASTSPRSLPSGQHLAFAWVANSEKQCPGRCAWPFAKSDSGPDTPALVPPNADVGADGIIINLATILAGALTNPFDSGYYQGDASAPMEAATACAGSFGPGSYSGYPGQLETDRISGASYNSQGANGRRFLLPALWNADTRTCTAP